MKFLMKSPADFGFGGNRSSVLPEGAVAAASEMVSFTVMEVDSVSTDIAMGMSRVAPARDFSAGASGHGKTRRRNRNGVRASRQIRNRRTFRPLPPPRFGRRPWIRS